MPFAATPLVAGETYETALRFGEEAAAELAPLAEPSAQAACLRAQWDRIAALGWPGIAVAEEEGGAGGDLAELAALLCGAGRTGLALPLATACGVVPALLSGHPLLADAASGSARIAAILPGATQDPGEEALRRQPNGALHGAAVGIEAPPAPTHVVAFVEGDAPALLLLRADAPGMELVASLRVDGRLAYDIRCRGAVPEAVLAEGDEARRRVETARDLGALLACVEGVSAMGALIEQTVAYLNQRVQFGAPLATQQALRHRVADMYVEYENLRGITAAALRAATTEDVLPWRAIAFAKLRLGIAGREVAESAIQCHGGMGMTEELPAIRLCKRLLMAEFEHGGRVFQARRLLAA
ncbi:acyl-CoA dehydrogenase family protein [Sabulicella rubraurantiaca]|uniref:acyl-CoA dehydrogenase family protein n=1 Tax=Sabulicella rubraurantiaca TaxID=2811429 RepID=UPI001A973157|nr:acyl-CoA dehydrogenase family protein [Sabulicella rubraurantiaca]